MGRSVHFGKTDFTLRLTGLHTLLALKNTITLPYQSIKHVEVGSFVPPKWMLRMPGTSFGPLNIYEGSFQHRNEWYFLSFAQTDSLLILEVEGHAKYQHVIVQLENPTEVAATLRKYLREQKAP
ncbi:hypothetical protein B5G50_06440 [Brevibacillus brevis]|uniref:hypothetical protein n=1 Tax=Brevibacillus brevis TaxID=1393 RepID=UPI000B378B50|nr:hypothetical protein [Brevibacillus brevis]OUQ89683.1 hypothetical protein B5G50_06440 [Brevibacillus brevis]